MYRKGLIIQRWSRGRLILAVFPAVVLGALLAVVLAFGGCSAAKKKNEAPAAFAIEKEYQRGPVTFTLKVDKKEMTIADRLQLVLEVVAQEDYEVRLPDFGENLEQFGIVDYHARPPTLMAGGLVQTAKTYVLEPFLSGDYIIPGMKVVFQKQGEGQEHEIKSEPVTIVVTSLLASDGDGLAIREIAPPVELPGSPWLWLYGMMGVTVLGGIGATVFIVLRRRRQPGTTVNLRPAHEIAYEELEWLLAEQLVERGAIKHFYLRLSHILRHYIEARFGLRAPERTTEEFLDDLRTARALIPPHKELLKEFLSHADMVKFAELQPSTMEIQQTFDSCKKFIMETATSEEKTVGRQVGAEESDHAL